MKIIKKICLFGLKMILPASNDNTNRTNNTNQNNLVYTNKM